MTHLDLMAASGILGSVSIACWVVVFSPQIIENFRRSSADGLSVTFIFIWLIGDVFNILGSVLQKVLPTMIILAVYYTLADIVLLLQCFYYRGFTLTDSVSPSTDSATTNANGHVNERTALLQNAPAAPATPPAEHSSTPNQYTDLISFPNYSRRPSSTASFRARLNSEPHLLSPANPMHQKGRDELALKGGSPIQRTNVLRSILVNVSAIILTAAAGVLGWYLSTGRHARSQPPASQIPTVNIWGQIFGYICTALYLASRLPQIILNFRRKSTEGISMLFFIFACLGNLTYVLSIFAYEAPCPEHTSLSGLDSSRLASCSGADKRGVYGWYILVNLSWLLGSAGTLFLDGFVFVQYFLYRGKSVSDDANAESAIE